MKNYTYFQLWEVPKGCSKENYADYHAFATNVEDLYVYMDQLKKDGSGWILEKVTRTEIAYEPPIS
jgi:hypothetical protein